MFKQLLRFKYHRLIIGMLIGIPWMFVVIFYEWFHFKISNNLLFWIRKIENKICNFTEQRR